MIFEVFRVHDGLLIAYKLNTFVGYFTGFVVLLHKPSFLVVSEKKMILVTDFKGFR